MQNCQSRENENSKDYEACIKLTKASRFHHIYTIKTPIFSTFGETPKPFSFSKTNPKQHCLYHSFQLLQH